MEIFQSTLFSNIIAILALSVAIYSIFYTRSQNRFHFTVSDIEIEKTDGYIELNIVIVNDSQKSQVLKDLIFLDENHKVMSHFDIDTSEPKYLDNGVINVRHSDYLTKNLYLKDQFQNPEFMLPNSTVEYSYNFHLVPRYIKIVSNERISKFRKHILISTDF